jgi:hypothetical protein
MAQNKVNLRILLGHYTGGIKKYEGGVNSGGMKFISCIMKHRPLGSTHKHTHRHTGLMPQEAYILSQIKVKVKSLCLIKHQDKTWGVEVQLHAFFISALDGGEWSASNPGRVTSGKEFLVRGWVRLKVDMDSVANRKSLPWTGIESR